MIFRCFAFICAVTIVCTGVAAQQPTPSPTTKIEARPLGASFNPQPVTKLTQTGLAISLEGNNFKFDYELPKLRTDGWYTGPDFEGTGRFYLVPTSEIRDITIRQTFDGGLATSIQSAIDKVRDSLKRAAVVLQLLGEEDFTAPGIQGKVFSYSMPVGGVYPRYTRAYVFTFNKSLFYVSIQSATKDRTEWVQKNGDEFVKSFRAN